MQRTIDNRVHGFFGKGDTLKYLKEIQCLDLKMMPKIQKE